MRASGTIRAASDTEQFPRTGTMDRLQTALAELNRLLARHRDDSVLAESALREACVAAMLAAYPAASGAEHEMDVRRLLCLVVEAYGADSESANPLTWQSETVYNVRALCDTVRRLRDRLD